MTKLTLSHAIWIGATLFVISCHDRERKIDSYENIRKSLKGVEQEKTDPIADPGGFESEVNNGGLNQYFFNASGQNCFATLRYFKQTGKSEEAKILEEAINCINPKKLPEKELIEKLRKRTVDELDDSVINNKLDKLDAEFYKLK
jgi:Domain of unknown function (DUF4375)